MMSLSAFRPDASQPREPSERPLRRVLYAIMLDPSRKFGSMEEQIFLQAQAFQKRGGLFLPLFLCPPGPNKCNRYHRAGLPAECLDLNRFSWRRLWELVRLIRRHRIAILHWNFTPPLANPYVWALSVATPTLRHCFTDHSSRDLPLPPPARGIKAFLKRMLLRRYSKVLCVSQFVYDCLVQQGTWSHLHLCLHFVNTDRFRPAPVIRQEVRRQQEVGNRFLIVTVAHLIPAKGVDVVCRAVAQLPDTVLLWLIGEGAELDSLQRLCQDLGIAERVRFLGNQAEIQPFLQAADCFVCPSRWAEAAGLVNLEAQASGLPVVASRIGGIPEYVEDGRTGLLFPPEDAASLANCLRRLHDDPALCPDLALNARQNCLERFSPHSTLESYLDLYR